MTRVLGPRLSPGAFPLYYHAMTRTQVRNPGGRNALWKLTSLMEIDKVAFGSFFLMISTATWKSLRKDRSSFPTVTHSAGGDTHYL